MEVNPTGSPTAYDWLGVHANAPSELISASYWLAAGALQKRRSSGERIDETLFALTRAYEVVTDPGRRAEYNAAVGHHSEPLTRRTLPKVRRTLRGRIFGRPQDYGAFDFYEVLGLSPDAPQEMLPEAWHIMRDHYLRLPQGSKRRKALLEALGAAYQTLSSPESRARYDARARTVPSRAAHHRADAGTSEVEAGEPATDVGGSEAPAAAEIQPPVDSVPASGEGRQYAASAEALSEAEWALSAPSAEATRDALEPVVLEHGPRADLAPEEEQNDPAAEVNQSPEPSVSALRGGPADTHHVTSADGVDDSRKSVPEVLVSLLRGTVGIIVVVAGATARLLGKGIRGAWRAAVSAWSRYRERRLQGRVSGPPPPIQPPISTGSRLTRMPQAQVEEAVLGRLANYMKEHQATEPESSKRASRGRG